MNFLTLFIPICSYLIFYKQLGEIIPKPQLIIFTRMRLVPTLYRENLTATISDHYPQFVIAPAIFSNSPSAKLNIFKRDWKTLFLTNNRCNFEKTF